MLVTAFLYLSYTAIPLSPIYVCSLSAVLSEIKDDDRSITDSRHS